MLTLDQKGRITVPARWREQLMAAVGGKLIITKNADGGLALYPPPVWEQLERVVLERVVTVTKVDKYVNSTNVQCRYQMWIQDATCTTPPSVALTSIDAARERFDADAVFTLSTSWRNPSSILAAANTISAPLAERLGAEASGISVRPLTSKAQYLGVPEQADQSRLEVLGAETEA